MSDKSMSDVPMGVVEEPCTDGPCSEASKHVWEYIDGEMSANDCARIKAHVETCESCSKLFRNELTVKEVVARACCEEAPSDLKGRVTAMVAKLRVDMCGK